MRCAINRWGPGTTKEKPCVTEATKELDARIAKMNEERAKQDKMWRESSTTQSNTTSQSGQSK